jgi:glutamate/aspartate transport system permease protein
MGGLEFDVIARTWPYLLKGLQYTIQLTIVAAIGGVIWGTLLALARLSSIKWLSMLAAGYVNLMRSIPLLLVIFWFYFLVPIIIQHITGADRPPQFGADRSAYIHHV